MVSDAYYPHPGGVSEHLHHLSQSLRKLGHRVVILTASYGKNNHYPDVIRVGRMMLLPGNLATITLTFDKKLPILVRNFFRKNRFDIVHTHGPLVPNLPFLALHYSKSKNFATFHTAFTNFNWYAVAKLFFKKEFKRIDGLICVSEYAREVLYPHFPGNYRIIPNGIDVKRFNPKLPPVSEISSPNPKILFVGRLDPRKGVDHLLDAFPLIKREIPDVELIVVGSGPSAEQYKRKAGSGVKFVGFVSAEMLPRYYVSCDLYCSPAIGGETFGIVLLEAMAAGTPVVASKISGYDRVVKDGFNGIFMDPKDPQDMAQAIIKVLKNKDLKKRLSLSGRKFSLRYSWDNVAKEVEELYRQVLS